MMSMYSLYRAWLLRDTPSIASPTLSLPPDLLITTQANPSPSSPYQFVAHRSLVCSHSGWLKATITAQEEYALQQHEYNPMIVQQGSTSGPQSGGLLQVSLPASISGEIFSPLLTFMYTGYLDLNLSNIYELLLAVNIMQMPHALDLCRSYLLHNVHSVANLTFNTNQGPAHLNQHLAKPIPSSILAKPIPGRPADLVRFPIGNMPSHCAPIPSTPPQEVPSSTTEINQEPQPSYRPILHQAKAGSRSTHPVKRLTKVRQRRSHRSLKSATTPRPRPLARVSDSDSSDDVTVVITEMPRSSGGGVGGEQGGRGNYGVDIASCDGPVHFTRVLNENYGDYQRQNTETNPSQVESKPNNRIEEDSNSEAEINIDELSNEGEGGEENEENIARNMETEASFRINFRRQIQRQGKMIHHGGGSEDDKMTSSNNKVISTAAGRTGNQQRRVIPRTVLKPVPAGVRLLDMNVQYYPCKTCGAKFPSYYFVHKHRRLVHPEEEPSPTAGVGGLVQVTSSTRTSPNPSGDITVDT
uniref:Uncharacterized protein n=1 Tax=Cacopsylla melanoneura TaxID=428564 RepID=A0A8D9B4K3_9HEMI